jgi:NAD(P)-dependent dehydrogenase (short-subunit alcohol dehydrogenase family)
MAELKGKKAVVVGASSGIGRSTLLSLAAQGMKTVGVARGRERLERIAREAPGEVTAMAGDASDPAMAARLIREADPDVLVIALGVHPHMAPADEQTWETFSAIWNGDLKATFHLGQEALRRPLRPGSTVIVVSSGAAIVGSSMSGGYAGAKRMQWFFAGYLQAIADKRKLGLRFVTIVPHQLIAGTTIGEAAAQAYSAQEGISPAALMERFGPTLTPDGVADVIVKVARDELGKGGTALQVQGKGVQVL